MPRAFVLSIWVATAASGAPWLAPQPLSFDVVILNGRVMDGSGNPWHKADIGIKDGRIAAVGRLGSTGSADVLDAAGRLVTPGFIDVHSHAADGLAREELRQGRAILAQGVTTIVANPDGGGPVDLAAQRARLTPTGPNVALLIGHGSVRRAVMGTAARAPSAEELERMVALVRRAMEEGSFGLSTGLFYSPGSHADTEEVIALARVAAAFGGVHTSHIRDESDYGIGLLAAVHEVIRVSEAAGLPGIVTHMKALGPDNWGLAVAAALRIEEARRRGVPVFADQYPYEASSTSLAAALLAPSSKGTGDSGNGGAATEDLVRENLRRRGGAAAIQIAVHQTDRSLEGRSLLEIASERRAAPERVALEMIERGGASIVSFNMSEEDIRHIMTRPWTMASSDGGLMLASEGRPHPRDYGAFARRLAVYVRERGVVSLEFAIRSMTSLPAMVLGMSDRGVIREGAAADIAIFDPSSVRDRATYADPHQLAEGMDYVLVNGVVVIRNGQFTDALPGRVLRR